ncbi:alpha/beta fold hydrolase [Actinomadura fibrosa]|uniref:Alpha/beta fold hydrolase n=1 Tax=Actinomadura fibrosa TaxID=111802 RepID=A0ABW2XNC6_9ACTN|nr:alpha/beta fold hydrolase [Actinomadura fibrosa]
MRRPRFEVRFCTAGDGVRIAYATVGQGPPLVMPPAWISHLELLWQDPAVRAFFLALAARRTVVLYDKPGCGLSDPWPSRQTVDVDVRVLRTVVDQLEERRVDLLGVSAAAVASLAFAVRHPERVGRLVVYGGYADGRQIGSPQVRAALLDLVRAHWGLGSDVLADIFMADADPDVRTHFVRLQRATATAEFACELLEQCYEARVEDGLDRLAAPALVLHRDGDRAIPYRLGRDLAARIPGARLVRLPGRSHLPWAGDTTRMIQAILEHLDGTEPDAVLTPRQLEVAALVADGLSNRQIARALGIEERSAEGHLERIRQRLDVRSRAQIAAWWVRHAR